MMNNPWKGLSSYKEADKSQYEFRGRMKASNALYVLLSNNLFCTLYGKMGCGKTSLLQAGVFPLLRQESFLPIVVRLNMNNGNDTLTDFLIKTIESECKRQQVDIRSNPRWKQYTGPSADSYKLWEYLYSHEFIDDSQNYVFPVIAIDQIEEAFNEHYNQTVELLSQLYYLISDDLRLPNDCYANFRVVMIIREDDLYLLEDAIEDGGFNIMKQNRYRLAPLTDEEAKEIIALGDPYFLPDEREAISERVLSLSKDDSSHVSTYMLSLLCSQVFINCKGKISLKDIPDSSTGLLQSFYENSIQHVLPDTKKYIESELIKDDRRNFVPLKEFKKNVASADFSTLTDGEFKMIQEIPAGTTRCVELLHDSLAKAIKKHKDEEKEKQVLSEQMKQMKRKRLLWMIPLTILACGLVVFLSIVAYNQHELAKSNRQRMLNDMGARDVNVIIDEDVAVKGLWWEASLRIRGTVNGKDTTVLDTLINKSPTHIMINKPIDVKLFDKLTVSITFPETARFECDSITRSNKELLDTDGFNFNLLIRLSKPILYGGQVVMTDSANISHPIENAIVVLGSEVTFTDHLGNFLFQLQDTLNNDSKLMVIKKYFSMSTDELDDAGKYLLHHPDEQAINQVVMMLSDSSYYNSFKDSYLDLISRTDQRVKELNSGSGAFSKSPVCQIKYNNTDSKIYMHLVFDGEGSGKAVVTGYYYYDKTDKNSPFGYYFIKNGKADKPTLNPADSLNYRSFELVGCDILGNQEIIRGRYITNKEYKSKPWQLDVFVNTRKVAESR